MKKSYWSYGSLYLPGIIALIFDQATKFLASTVVVNPDVSFSWSLLPQGQNLQIVLIALVLVGIAFFARWHLRSRSHFWLNVSYSVLLGSAISNWLDRIFYSGVRDIWSTPLWGLHNNLADWLIVTSVSVIIVTDLLLEFRLSKTPVDEQ